MKGFINSEVVSFRALLLGSGALLALAAPPVAAQNRNDVSVEEIVVTAQRREQNLQDVPIAITAISQTALQTNRITSVMDLNTQAPNLTLRSTAGGIGVANFSMRGSVSYGSVPGQDKAISTYLDGVYIGSAFGSAFELPDLERIEVLRGPQGTLFGRNATAGAINVVTRDPSGKFGVRQVFTVGNYDQFRSSTRVELPALGSLSASVSYTHNERTGDMKNLGAGTVWNRNGPRTRQGIAVSPKTLGDQNSESVFVAVKFEPSDNFKTVYKFDWMHGDFTPEGNAAVALTPQLLGPFGDALALAYAANPVALAGNERPKAVNNSFSTPGFQRVEGHNMTTTVRLADDLTVKNILAYRRSYIYANSDIGGLGGLVVTQAVADNLAGIAGFPPGSLNILIGSPYVPIASQVQNRFKQWSDEIQFNYDSQMLTLTAGAIYYHSNAVNGAPDGLRQTVVLSPVFGGNLFEGRRNLSFNTASSLAGYAQAEVHVTPELDVIGGIRVTKDKKSGTAYLNNAAAFNQLAFPFTYKKTKPNYSIGANYRPNDGILVYAKYSTGFVSGGSVSDIPFPPETVKAWEGGIKADLFDRRLRANLALFKADYKNIQSVGGGATLTPPRNDLSTIVVRESDLDTKGFELELNAAPIRGVSLNASLGYTDVKESNVNTFLRPPGSLPTARAKWTSTLSAQYETDPLFSDTTVMARVDASWRSKIQTLSQTNLLPDYDAFLVSDDLWLINGRVALRHLNLAGADVELAGWVRNLTDAGNPTFPIYYTFSGSATYERARTYGLDLSFEF